MQLSELLDLDNLRLRIEQGYINEQLHPVLPYNLLCYTTSAQLEWLWDNETMTCRGLIYNRDTGEIVARPFRKFGTYEQHITWTNGRLPQGHFQAYDKLDGSLGILYPIQVREGSVAIATKGSFGSEQAVWASRWVRQHLNQIKQWPLALFKLYDYTYLFEIIYPENRVVVDYGDRAEVVLLDVLDIETGQRDHAEFQRIEAAGWPTVQPVQVDYSVVGNHAELYKQVPDHQEGFVLVYDNGERIKVKGERYLELHRLKANLVPKRIIPAYLDGGMEWVKELPDEFQPEVLATVELFDRYFGEIQQAVNKAYRAVRDLSRKEAAFWLQKNAPEVANGVFQTIDGKLQRRLEWMQSYATRKTLDHVEE